jgi:glutaconyl-CoA/methylmalonyl-CoA decarboxylase subunit gamma
MKSYKITVNGQSYDVTVEEVGAAASRVAAPGAGAAPLASAASQANAPAKAGAVQIKAGAVQIKAPMPGTLLSFKVAQGQAVKKGDVVLILEAMKMENEIVAPSDGVVTALRVSEGASVNTGEVLAELG